VLNWTNPLSAGSNSCHSGDVQASIESLFFPPLRKTASLLCPPLLPPTQHGAGSTPLRNLRMHDDLDVAVASSYNRALRFLVSVNHPYRPKTFPRIKNAHSTVHLAPFFGSSVCSPLEMSRMAMPTFPFRRPSPRGGRAWLLFHSSVVSGYDLLPRSGLPSRVSLGWFSYSREPHSNSAG